MLIVEIWLEVVLVVVVWVILSSWFCYFYYFYININLNTFKMQNNQIHILKYMSWYIAAQEVLDEVLSL